MMNISPNEWRRILLKQDPFPSIPPRRPEDAVWAGFRETRAQLDKIYEEALTTLGTQMVLCRGERGSGKTHAAAFARRQDYLASFCQKQLVKGVEVFYLQLPKEAEYADELLFRNFLEAIQFRKLRAIIREISASGTPEEMLEKFQRLSGNETLGRAIWLLGMEDGDLGKIPLLNGNREISKQQQLIERYFFSQATKSDLKLLGLSRNIKGTEDRFHLLASLFQCIIGLEPVENIKAHKRVILWIDEMEDLTVYSSRYLKPFMKGLYDMLDRLSSYLSIITSFTLSSLDDTYEVGITAGKGFLDRVTHQLYFRTPNEQEAFEYLTDLLAAYRTEQPEAKGLPCSYPFEETALRTLIADLQERTPRDLNLRCADVLAEAFRQQIFTAPGCGIIDQDFVRSVEDRRIKSQFV